MFLTKKAQSTAEYAIVFGLIIALTAGVLQVALKKGITAKGAQALKILSDAGTTPVAGVATVFDSSLTAGNLSLYQQDWRSTKVTASNDTSVLSKGGKEEKLTTQTSSTEAVSVETLDSAN